MEPGYGSPIGAHDTVVVIDDLVERSPNLVAGANREGFHYRNVNAGRDYTADVVADITNAQEGDPCPACGKHVILRNGIEVGNIFKLGTKYTDAAGATYLGEDGQAHPIVMGSYGIGVGRNVACIVEAHHDDKGIVWPAEVAPYAAHLVSIGAAKEPHVTEVAERLHSLAAEAGARHEILWDDRDESPGVKFTDAELLGMPWILTVSPRSLAAGGIEVTERATGERTTRPIEEVESLLVEGFRRATRPPEPARLAGRDRARRHRVRRTIAARARSRSRASVDRRAIERDDELAGIGSLLHELGRRHDLADDLLLRLILDAADGEGHARRDRRRDRDLGDPVRRSLLAQRACWSSPAGPWRLTISSASVLGSICSMTVVDAAPGHPDGLRARCRRDRLSTRSPGRRPSGCAIAAWLGRLAASWARLMKLIRPPLLGSGTLPTGHPAG